MSEISITYIDISSFAHATEDENKVLMATRRLLPETCSENIKFIRSNLRGHYGNEIILFKTRIKEKEIINAIASHLALKLDPSDKERLRREMRLHVDKKNFYLRLNKQLALKGEFKLGGIDTVRFRLRFKKKQPQDIIQICREIGIST